MSSPPRKRATTEQLNQRIDKVITLLRQGCSESAIRKLLVEQDAISDKTARRTIQMAWDMFGALGTQSTDQQRGLLLSRVNHLFTITSHGTQQNLNQAIKVLSLQSQLLFNNKGSLSYDIQNESVAREDILSPRLAAIFEQPTTKTVTKGRKNRSIDP